MDMSGLQAFDFDDGHYRHKVYSKGSGKPVLLMHELPGLTRETLGFTDRLVDAGFRVYLPLLFGKPEEKGSLLRGYALCINREFAYLKAGRRAPVSDWLRALVRDLGERDGHARMGVIGMCVTGAFVIPLILESNVAAAVASQPAIPFRFGYWLTGRGAGDWMGELNVADKDLQDASLTAASDGTQLLVQRFSDDRLCAAARVQRLQKAFGDRAVVYTYAPPDDGRDTHHALLTYEFTAAGHVPSDHPTRLALRRVIEFLQQHL